MPLGVPQIDVSFDIHANGFLEVSAEDMPTSRSNPVPATRDRLLPQPVLDRMVLEAEKYRDEDEAYKAKFEAKKGLVNYCFMLRFTRTEDCSRHVVGASKEELEKAGRDALDRLDENQLAVKAEFESQSQGIERSCQPDHDEGVPGCRWM